MGRHSKEEDVLRLFFENPAKHWHFCELNKEIRIAESKLAKWLKRFQEEKIITRTKEKGKMPYYVSNHEDGNYKLRKRIYAMNQLCSCGILDDLADVECAILFGSFARSDWYFGSDIDIFIYGDGEINLQQYESKLRREIQIFSVKNKEELKKFRRSVIYNVLRGVVVKGTIPQEVSAYVELQKQRRGA
ncbi:nucleotidyltransferase domain-containing protein [Candidatus Woesearchaeota archaeon]|nr:nucleotidyltransferase domain-containing protein [Candidatus Woesearchaeota archaeon]